ncbi:MAG TPA: TerC/Alx family metal homeostasis membrane protein [Candidatus Acidoferrales bacterium]|nr:TerC/Alx family metal homeostasis membrane protein [Candidatus Acidoferrales bacterium]
MNEPTSLLWFGLFAVAAAAVVIDIVIHRRGEFSVSTRTALLETAGWVALALLFDLWIFYVRGKQASIQFLSGYLIEQSLSIDNIFLFLIIFRSFQLPPRAQHRILYYGVAGALAMRIAFVFAGVTLLEHFQPVVYIFGAILFITAFRMLFPRREETAPSWVVRVAGRFLPLTKNGDGRHFFIREDGKWKVTPLFLVLLTIEAVDVIFATDSIPAVLSVTRDAFIAYSSNVFAVLGLRAIYFVLSGILRRVRFLHQGLAAVLIFTGIKMVASNYISIPDTWSLAIIGGIFALTTAVSLYWPAKQVETPQ